jgi:ATP/maltotriose-dependent transcriptional regulator MalT
MDTLLLATKLRIPPQPHRALRRARLIDALERAIPHHKLILLSAPAGYGKTTLLHNGRTRAASRLPGCRSARRITTSGAFSATC